MPYGDLTGSDTLPSARSHLDLDNWFEARARAEEYLDDDAIDWSVEATG